MKTTAREYNALAILALVLFFGSLTALYFAI